MKKITCTIRFLTPAFLGDANGNGAWRVPPFKAELRQWWRVVLAARGMDWETIRSHEANLFGNAWPDQTASKSAVRMRLDKWSEGKLQQAPDIRKIENGKAQVNGGLYTGYGEIAYDKETKGVKLEHPPAIDAGDHAGLRIGITTTSHHADQIPSALALMSRYGTLGGRSRNGWGSFVLEGDDIPAITNQTAQMNLQKALDADWVRGIGADAAGPLVWRTSSKSSWEKVMHELAQLRSDINRGTSSDAERGLLSYPVTKKSVRGWSNQDRVPNSLRFKIIADGEQRRGLIIHTPCQPGNGLWQKHPKSDRPQSLVEFWQGIHEQLDNRNELQRVPA